MAQRSGPDILPQRLPHADWMATTFRDGESLAGVIETDGDAV